jgi:hypothetical protein
MFSAFCGIAATRPEYSVIEWIDAAKTSMHQKGLFSN